MSDTQCVYIEGEINGDKWKDLIPSCLHEIKMCLGNYSPLQKLQDHITVNSTQSKSSRQTAGNILTAQTENNQGWMSDMWRSYAGKHALSQHIRSLKINKRTTKTERTAGHLWILILLSTLYRIKLYIIVQILQLEQSVTCVQQNSNISHSLSPVREKTLE